jgi:hypothetical protein
MIRALTNMIVGFAKNYVERGKPAPEGMCKLCKKVPPEAGNHCDDCRDWLAW